MRRPLVPPDQAAAVVRRNTWQGMAQARVPAAYPVPRVRLPRMLGGLKGAAAPVIPPEAVLVSSHDGGDVRTFSLPSLTGYTSAVALYVSVGVVGHGLPSGWRVLASGTVGTAYWASTVATWYLLCVDEVTGSEALDVTTTAGVSGSLKDQTAAVFRFTGSSGGAWAVTDGAGTAGSYANFAAPPSGSEVFVQLGALFSVGTYDPIVAPAGVYVNAGPCGWYSPVEPGSYSGAGFATFTGTPFASPDTVDWGMGLTYDNPAGHELAVGYL